MLDQKIKGLRSANYRVVNGHITKPLMGLLTCRVCGHAITGESHRKSSGRIYIYYHCANQTCPERRINCPQAELFSQLKKAFEPFSRFTPAATKSFVETLQTRMQDLELYTQKTTGELAEKRMKIKENILKLEQLRMDGLLTPKEFQELLTVKSAALDEVKIEIDAHNEADHRTFKEGLRIIELFVKVHNFMRLEGNELEKVRLAKMVLSNPTLANRTIEFSYQKPFDVLLQLTSEKIWWTRGELNPRPKVFPLAIYMLSLCFGKSGWRPQTNYSQTPLSFVSHQHAQRPSLSYPAKWRLSRQHRRSSSRRC